MRVLFVDDDPMILKGIERALFHLSDWEIDCETSGERALERLARTPYDVLVTDMRMPGMDGGTLLEHAHERFPEVVRIVLSAQAEQQAVLRTVAHAHQFLAKPCGPVALQAAIERTAQLQGLLRSPEVRRVVAGIDTLPTAPEVHAQLAPLLAAEEVDLSRVSRLLESDPPLCAKILQTVNSAFFSTGAPVHRVHEAVVRLGASTLRNLVLTLEVMAAWETVTPDSRSGRRRRGFERQRSHAQRVAALAAALYDDRGARAEAFAAGTLHDLGQWVLATHRPELSERIEARMRKGALARHAAEHELLGCSHAEIGAYLLGLWNLPDPLVLAVAHHHTPPHRASGSASQLELATAVCLANTWAHTRTLEADMLERLGLTDAGEHLTQRLAAAGGDP